MGIRIPSPTTMEIGHWSVQWSRWRSISHVQFWPVYGQSGQCSDPRRYRWTQSVVWTFLHLFSKQLSRSNPRPVQSGYFLVFTRLLFFPAFIPPTSSYCLSVRCPPLNTRGTNLRFIRKMESIINVVAFCWFQSIGIEGTQYYAVCSALTARNYLNLRDSMNCGAFHWVTYPLRCT